jgi:hypothetical protein
MRINLKYVAIALVLLASTVMLSECMAPPPDMAPAATGTFQHESYRSELQHREDMIEQGRALHVKKQKLVV